MKCYDEDEDFEEYEEDEGKEGVCSECGAHCTAVVRDFGIGKYEAWGFVGTHVDKHAVSPCCEAEVVDEKIADDVEA